MSIVRCEECEKTIDLDKEEAIEYMFSYTNYYWLCTSCEEENN